MQTSYNVIEKRYAPYGMNGLYFIYDNKENCIPLGYGSKSGTKKKIQTMCDQLNKSEQQ